MIKNIPYTNMLIDYNKTLKFAMEALNKKTYTFFVVVNKNKKVIGSITDGDIRRAILKGLDINSKVVSCMNKSPKTSSSKNEKIQEKGLLKIKGAIKFLPIVDSKKRIISIVIKDTAYKAKVALIMAGGFGKRLGYKTKKTPKPLLKIGKNIILETIIRKLESSKYKDIFISTHYLHSKINNFINKRQSISNIKTLFEKKPLGTAGSISMLKKEKFNTLTVLNGDIISDINLEALENFHQEKNNDITISVAKFKYKVPFGVIKFDDKFNYISLEEKPDFSSFILSGIYCLNKSVCNIVTQEFYDMPDLLNLAHKSGFKIGIFPIYEYWNDIGTPKKFNLEKKRNK